MGAAVCRVVAAIGCVVAVAAGVALTVCTGGLGAGIVAGALLGFGMAGFMYTVRNWENFSFNEFFRQGIVGAIVGAVGGGLLHGVSGAAAHFAGSLVKQSIVYTLGGAATGFICNVVQNVATGKPVFQNWWQSLAIGAVGGLLMGLAAGLADKLTNVMVKSREALKLAEASIFKSIRPYKEIFHFVGNLASSALTDVVAQLMLTGKVDAGELLMACGAAAFMGLAGAAAKRRQSRKDMQLIEQAEQTRQAYKKVTGKHPEMTCAMRQRGSKSVYTGVNSKTNWRVYQKHGGRHPRQYRSFQKRLFGSKARFRGQQQMPCAEGHAATEMMRANNLHQGKPDTKALSDMLRNSKGVTINAYGQYRPPCQEACRGQFDWNGYQDRRWFSGPDPNYYRVAMRPPPEVLSRQTPQLPSPPTRPPPLSCPQPDEPDEPDEPDSGEDDDDYDVSSTSSSEHTSAEELDHTLGSSSGLSDVADSENADAAEADVCDTLPGSDVDGNLSVKDEEATAPRADLTMAEPSVDGVSPSAQAPGGSTASPNEVPHFSDAMRGETVNMLDASKQEGTEGTAVEVSGSGSGPQPPPPPPPPGGGINRYESFAAEDRDRKELLLRGIEALEDAGCEQVGYVPVQVSVAAKRLGQRSGVPGHGRSLGSGSARSPQKPAPDQQDPQELRFMKLLLQSESNLIYLGPDSLPPADTSSVDFHAHLRPCSVLQKFRTPGDGNCFFHAEASDNAFVHEDPVGVRHEFTQHTCRIVSSEHRGKVHDLFLAMSELWQDVQRGNADEAKKTRFFVKLSRKKEQLEQDSSVESGKTLASLLETELDNDQAGALEACERWITSGAWMGLCDAELYAAVMNKYFVIVVDTLIAGQPLWVMHYFPGSAPAELQPNYMFYCGTERGHFEGLKMKQRGHGAQAAEPMLSVADEAAASPSAGDVRKPLAESVPLIEPSASRNFKMTANPNFSFEPGTIGTVCFTSMTRNMGITRLQRQLVYALGYSTNVDQALSAWQWPPVLCTKLPNMSARIAGACDHLALFLGCGFSLLSTSQTCLSMAITVTLLLVY